VGNRLENRAIIVTGGASGIGEALCRGFAREGASVTVADINQDAATLLADAISSEGGRAIAVVMDVTNRDQVRAGIERTVSEFGQLSAYFNNAGMNSPMKLLDVTEDNFNLIMRVNVWGVLVGMQEAAQQFLRQGTGGKIVNTASIAGRTGFPSFAPYSAAKSAVISLTQAGARAWGSDNITVNGFAPGVVDTPLWVKLDEELEAIGEADGKMDKLSSQIILGRPALPEDIVPTGVFLAGPDSDYITGQIIPIEGGMILV
jgi:meso-butanediol dehydrogenase / (S,S)-butanediol dehydrogenase / diacetyl reductase